MVSRRAPTGVRRLLYILGSSLLLLAAVIIAASLLKSTSAPKDFNDRQAATMNGNTTQNDLLVRVNAVEHTFAGAFVTRGVLHIWLTDPSDERAQRVRTELARIDSKQFAAKKFTIYQARYSFEQLYRWKEDIGDLHLLVPVVSVAISIPDNDIELGVTNVRKWSAQIHAELMRRNIPQDAVRVEEHPPGRLFGRQGEGAR